MKLFSHKYIPAVTLACGAAGFAARWALELLCIDEKGLYLTGHPSFIGLFALSALVTVWLFLCCRKLTGKAEFPSSLIPLFGSIVAAAGILITDVYELILNWQSYCALRDAATQSTLIISTVCFVLGILAAGALILAGILQQKSKRVHFLFYAILAVYLMVHPLSQYRMWSSDPQLLTYCFHLLASICLLLTAYHRTALDAGKSGCKRYVFFSQLALFFCCVSIQGESWLFYLTMALWVAANTVRFLPEEES